MYKLIQTLILISFSIVLFSQKIEIKNSVIKTYKSIMVEDQVFELQIILPNTAKNSSVKNSLIIVLDGQWDTPLVGSLHGQQYYDGFAPESIIVGVTWSGENPNYDSLRRRDFVPSLKDSPGGTADKFFNSLAYEIIPFIEENYSIDKEKISLMGSSFGGLFTLYAYFAKPQLFNCYIAASPALSHDKDLVAKIVQDYDKYRKGKKKLYLTYGSAEIDVEEFKKFSQQLKDQNISNLELKTDLFENIGHAGTKGPTYTKGIQFANEKPRIKIKDERIKELSGIYYNKDLKRIELYQVLDQLYIKYGDYNLPLYAATQNEFYSISTNMKLNFFSNMKGFAITTFGKTEMFKM
jgi:predicted alpha/beta superfamily hydrolase